MAREGIDVIGGYFSVQNKVLQKLNAKMGGLEMRKKDYSEGGFTPESRFGGR
jgi:hypothetical protein